MKNFLKSTLGTLSIWAILFVGVGILANWLLGAQYLFAIIFALTVFLVLIGIFIGIKNTVKDAEKTAETKSE